MGRSIFANSSLASIAQQVRRSVPAGLARLLAGAFYGQRHTLRRLIKDHQQPLLLSNQQFAGPGWATLQHAIRESQFVLIGEDHGIAQIPLFTAAVARLLQPAVYVAELDTYQTQDLCRLAAELPPPTAYLRQHPGGLSFYSWVEEFELVRKLRAQQVQIVGIDQVFLASSGRFYACLAEKVRNPATKTFLQACALEYQAQDRASLQQDTPDFAIFTQPQAAIDNLLALMQTEGPEAQEMARAYATSYHIYQRQLAQDGGHQQRVSLLKRNLLHALRQLEPHRARPLPKMLFKFGALHVSRNLSPLVSGEFFDIGNLMHNLADAQDHKSLHIFIVGKQGTKAVGSHPDDPGKDIMPYTTAELPFLQPFFAQTRTEWNVIDLRPAREAVLAGRLRPKNQDLLRTIIGYDFLVIIPETTASSSF